MYVSHPDEITHNQHHLYLIVSHTHPEQQDPTARGFRPCVYLGGAGDRLTLLGLKSGPGRREFDKFDSFQRRMYQVSS